MTRHDPLACAWCLMSAHLWEPMPPNQPRGPAYDLLIIDDPPR